MYRTYAPKPYSNYSGPYIEGSTRVSCGLYEGSTALLQGVAEFAEVFGGPESNGFGLGCGLGLELYRVLVGTTKVRGRGNHFASSETGRNRNIPMCTNGLDVFLKHHKASAS